MKKLIYFVKFWNWTLSYNPPGKLTLTLIFDKNWPLMENISSLVEIFWLVYLVWVGVQIFEHLDICIFKRKWPRSYWAVTPILDILTCIFELVLRFFNIKIYVIESFIGVARQCNEEHPCSIILRRHMRPGNQWKQ